MFSQKKPIPVELHQVYALSRSPYEHAVATNMATGAPHFFNLAVKGGHATMTVDGEKESTVTFCLAGAPFGCFSLASNGTKEEPGAFRYVRLTVDGETVLDIDFEKITSMDELEPFFDCFFFPSLEREQVGLPVPIKQYWTFNERGHLRCTRPRAGNVPANDCGPFCVLTLRHPPFGDFEAEIGFEQCWRRYGAIFGCEKRTFPYYSMPKTYQTIGVSGAFAYSGSHNGSCCMRGALKPSDDPSIRCFEVTDTGFSSFCYHTTKRLIPSFGSKNQLTLPRHTLAYCKKGNMTYHFENEQFTEQPGAVIYLPPNTPCRLEGDADHLIRIEFECITPKSLSPAIYVCERPETVRRMFDELIDIWHSTLPRKDYRALSVFYRIMAEIARPSLNNATATIRVATQYIDAHFCDMGLSVKAVAAAAGVSESYLYQLFREAGEMSPKEYILDCRIHYACTLLKTHYYKVYEVAEKCGFADPKYFMTVFKNKIGVSPGQYSKN